MQINKHTIGLAPHHTLALTTHGKGRVTWAIVSLKEWLALAEPPQQ